MTLRHLRRLCRASDGSMAIETGIVASALTLLSLGSFQISSLVARQSELEIAAAEAGAIALAAKPDTAEKLATVKTILMNSTGLPTNKVSVSFRWRCGDETAMTSNRDDCDWDGDDDDEDRRWKFVRIQLNDTYTPGWRGFGLGSNVNIQVDRTVQIK